MSSSPVAIKVLEMPSMPQKRGFLIERPATLADRELHVFSQRGEASDKGLYSFLADQLFLPKVTEVRIFAGKGHDHVVLTLDDAEEWERALSVSPAKIEFTHKAGQKTENAGGKSYLDLIREKVSHYAREGSPLVGTVNSYHATPEFLEELNDYAQENMPQIVREHEGDIILTKFDAQKGALSAQFKGGCATNNCSGGHFATSMAFTTMIRRGFPNVIRHVAFENDPTKTPQPALDGIGLG